MNQLTAINGTSSSPVRRVTGKTTNKKQESVISLKRLLSWSQISQFEYDKEKWYRSYVLGQKDPPSAEMLFGNKIGKQLENDPTFMPYIPRESHMEYKFQAKLGKVEMIGYADSYSPEKYLLREYKTGIPKWDQKRVDLHAQIDCYLLMLYLSKGIKPEQVECHLHWMPTKKTEHGDFTKTIEFVDDIEQNVQHFTTKRTTRDILEFGVRINKVLKEMEEFKLSKKSLSTS